MGSRKYLYQIDSFFLFKQTGNESPPELDFYEFGLWDAIFNAGL